MFLAKTCLLSLWLTKMLAILVNSEDPGVSPIRIGSALLTEAFL